MSTITALETEVKALRREVTELRRYIGFYQTDPEGEYRPEFINKMRKLLRSSSKKEELIEFTTPKEFLRQVREI